MSFTIDLYTDRRTWIHAIDPRVKLGSVAMTLILLLRFRNVYVLLVFLILLHVLHAAARTPWRRLGAVWKALLPTNILVATLWVLFYPSGEAIVEFWRIKITWISLAQGLAVAFRIDAMALAVFAWLYTTEQPALVRGLVKLGLPYAWGLTLALALRYIPSFQGLYAQIASAQQARGLQLDQGSGFGRVRLMMPIFVAMIISALRSSEQLARALEARGFGSRSMPRTYLHDLVLRPQDYILTALLLVSFTVLLALNLLLDFGAHPIRLF